MKYIERYAVRSYETDSSNVMRPSTVLQYMQETAERQMRHDDIDYTDLYIKKRKAFIVSRMNIELLRPIMQNEDLDVSTWYVQGRAANFPRNYEFVSGGDIVMKATSNWAMVDVDTKKLVLNKDYDMSDCATDEELHMSVPKRFTVPRDISFRNVYKRLVTYSMTDINGHVNNTIYPDMLWDAVPCAGDYNITSMNIRFVHEARIGDVADVVVSEACNPEKMDCRAEKIYYVYSEVSGRRNAEAAFGVIRRK